MTHQIDVQPDREKDEFLLNLIKNAAEESQDRNFYEIVVISIFTEICKFNVFSEWLQRREKIRQRIDLLDAKISSETEKSFVDIKSDLITYGLLNNPYVYSIVSTIEEVLIKKKTYSDGAYPYIQNVYVQMEQLLNTLLSLGHDKIVSKYAKLTNCHIPMVNVHTGKLEMVSKCIDEFIFAPTFTRKNTLTAASHKSKVEDIWGALDLLHLLEWCWNTPESYFRSEQHGSLLHSYWSEIDGLRKGEMDGLSFFKREKIESCLNIIFKSIAHGKSAISVIDNRVLSLRIDNRRYLLILTVSESNDIINTQTSYILHRFRGEKSKALESYRQLFSSSKAWVNVIKGSINGSSKFLERTGCKNVLGIIFFVTNGSLIKLKSKSISCRSLQVSECRDLRDLLPELKILQQA